MAKSLGMVGLCKPNDFTTHSNALWSVSWITLVYSFLFATKFLHVFSGREEIFVEHSKLVKGLCPETRLDVFFPGFPTLKHVKHTVSRALGYGTTAKLNIVGLLALEFVMYLIVKRKVLCY